MHITGRISDHCPNGVSCPRIHDTDGDDVIVQGTTVTDPGLLDQVDPNMPAHESAVAVPRTLLTPATLDLDTYTGWIFARHTWDLLRIENRRTYLVESDGDDYRRHQQGLPPVSPVKAAWLALLAEHTAQGRRWRRLHVLPAGQPLTPYEHYQFAAFGDNVAAGEDVRILTATDPHHLAGVPDFFVLDGRHVARSVYDADGRHLGGHPITEDPHPAVYRALAAAIWQSAVPFRVWQDRHPDLLAA